MSEIVLKYLSPGVAGIVSKEVEVKHYPSGEPYINFNIAEAKIGSQAILAVKTAKLETFMAALFFADAIKDMTDTNLSLEIPYVIGSRQDRRMHGDGDALMTAKSVASAINAREFYSVLIDDPHSDVISALIDRVIVVPAKAYFLMGIEKGQIKPDTWHGVIAPDGGAIKRAYDVAEVLNVPLFYGWKKRDTSTGKLSGFGCQEITLPAGSRLLIVDDICDGGGTFLGLAEAIGDKNPELVLDLYVTHGFFTGNTEALLSTFNQVYTTETVIRDSDDGLVVLRENNDCN